MTKPVFSKYILVVALITLTFVITLRFFRLGSIPLGITKDESYYGYDALTILKTGKDIWGNKYPLYFKSTGEYKMNLTYLMVPFVKIFGLNGLSVRLPSAIFGIATLVILFFTLRLLLKNNYLALILTVIYALSPIPYGMSRLFYESNVGLFFMSVGIYLILQKRVGYAAIPFALAAYLYNPYRYIGGVILIGLLMVSWWGNRSQKLKFILKPILVWLLVLMPLLIFSVQGASTGRLGQELKLRQESYALEINDMRSRCYLEIGSVSAARLCYPFWNKLVSYIGGVSEAFLRPMLPDMVFLNADNIYIVPEGYGAFFNFLLPFYLVGLVWLIGIVRTKSLPVNARPLLLWSIVVSSGIVAATGSVELYRHAFLMYLLFLVISIGANIVIANLSNISKHLRISLILLVAVVAIFQASKFLINYQLYSQKYPLVFSYDLPEIYEFLSTKRDDNLIVDKIFHGPISAAFVWQLDPAVFQRDIVWTDPDPWGFINAYELGNIYSQHYTLSELLCMKNKTPDEPLKTLIIDDVGLYGDAASLITYDSTRSLKLHAVYDIDTLYPYVLANYPSHLCKLN